MSSFILGTHNSGTGARLVWWQWLFGWFINTVSRCQDKTIGEQLEMGVRVFNLQVARYRGDWYVSHGLALYDLRLSDVLSMFEGYDGVYFQLVLDRNFLLGQSEEDFRELVEGLRENYSNGDCVMLWAWIEGEDFVFKNDIRIDLSERYWTFGGSRGFLGRLPLPRIHARKDNPRYIGECESDYLMLDFV